MLKLVVNNAVQPRKSVDFTLAFSILNVVANVAYVLVIAAVPFWLMRLTENIIINPTWPEVVRFTGAFMIAIWPLAVILVAIMFSNEVKLKEMYMKKCKELENGS